MSGTVAEKESAAEKGNAAEKGTVAEKESAAESQNQNHKFNLLITGVGGQGAILASDIIGKAAVSAGLPIRAAETHGMAQRGGSVENHIRIGKDLGSMIPKKGADLLLALEPMEAVRYLDYLKDGGVIIVNTETIIPITVTSGQAKYPEVSKIIEALGEKYEVKAFNADEVAVEAGNRLAMNVVMVGAVSNYLPIPVEVLLGSVKKLVPPKTIEVNVKAFEMGREKIQGS